MARPKKQPVGKAAIAHRLIHAPCHIDERRRRNQQVSGEGPWQSERTDLESVGLRMDWLRALPTDPDHHYRGYFENGWLNFRFGDEDKYLPFSPYAPGRTQKFHLFHSQPTRSVYSEIPAREDIFRFLKFESELLIVVSCRRFGILKRCHRSSQFSAAIRDWEAGHPHEIARILARKPQQSPQEIFRRYAKVALKAIGLRWPDKNYKRRSDWPQCLEDIGIATTRLDRDA